MTSNPKKPSLVSLRDLPLHQIVALSQDQQQLDEMSPAEIRDAIKFTAEKRTSPQRRRSDAAKQSKELQSGKPKKNMLDDFM